MNQRMSVKKLLAVLLAATMLITLFAGCQGRDEPADSKSSSMASFEAEDTGEKVSTITPDQTEKVLEKKELNDDTVGWLAVPGLEIDDVVVQKKDDKINMYYVRLNFEEEYSFNGIFYADFRAEFGDGSREELGTNTTIYGHAIVDNHDRDDERYKIKFGPLHDLRDPEKAKDMPYINLSTEKEDMVFEIIAVFIANADNPDLPYNDNLEPAEMLKMVQDEVLPRSLYNYEAAKDLTEDDKYLTLSTCLYYLEDGTALKYPETKYRYAIMAKLLDPDDEVRSGAAFTINEDPVVDPEGNMAS